MPIKSLFDSSKDIYRTIEKVITYGVSQEQRLKAEISEYIVTESIEEQMEKLLTKMQLAMEAGGENEVGVWVSGFYGSGKSSFTKYLGLAMNYWPERVLRKCHQDRSLAIAHGVEADFWEEVEEPVLRRGRATGETKRVWRPKTLSNSELEAVIRTKLADRR